MRRANPHLVGRTLIALTVWCSGAATVQSVMGLNAVANSAKAVTRSTPSTAPAPAHTGTLATVAKATMLPSGPTGDAIPPGTLAPDHTYANSYTWGQCTWYVAGRRQIPAHWGNAVSWYARARAAGWSEGTTPAVGAIAWTSAGWAGHVALVEQVSADGSQVYVSEMNYRGVGIKSTRWVPASQFKYIY